MKFHRNDLSRSKIHHPKYHHRNSRPQKSEAVPGTFLSVNLWVPWSFGWPAMWGPRSISKLVNITPMSLWFMVLITIVNYTAQKNIRATYSCAGKNSRVALKTRRHGLVSPWLAKHQRAKKRAGNWLHCLTIVNSAYKPTNITGGPHIVWPRHGDHFPVARQATEDTPSFWGAMASLTEMGSLGGMACWNSKQ